MKKIYTFLLIVIPFLTFNGVFAQSGSFPLSGMPLNPKSSPLFGKDIIINDQPSQNQQNVCVCSAFNGWLYALYTNPNAVQGHPGYKIFKSIDNGITWLLLIDKYSSIAPFITSSDMIVTGNAVSNLKIFLVYVVSGNESTGLGDIYYMRFNAETGDTEDGAYIEGGFDVSVSSDFMQPAINSNPYSVGILYSKYYSLNRDSIIFKSSSNGGINFENRKALAGTTNKFLKVSLAYGRSLSQPNGRYYAAWEEKADYTSNAGHIYTAHTEPYFYSPFTTPVMIDNLDPSTYNNVKNPAIACQYSNIDNDSSNLTEVVLFDKFIPTTSKYEIGGFYNMKSTSTNNFTPFVLNSSTDSKQHASISFNPFDSTFMVTCYDSTTGKLPFFTQNFNMINPDTWQVVHAGYNDNSNLAAPYPKVSLNISERKGMNVWSAEGTGGNGIAMFDAPYSTYTSIPDSKLANDVARISIYPNPCSANATLSFMLDNPGHATIILVNPMGEQMATIADRVFPAGRSRAAIDMSGFAPGIYQVVLTTGNRRVVGKVVKVE